MKGTIVQNNTSPPTLTWGDVTDVKAAPATVLVDIHATAVNRADLLQAAGNYPPPEGASPVLGLEMAGVVTAVGAEVSGWQVGDRVCALLSGGGYAEQTAVHPDMLLPIPDRWSFVQAAAVPEVWYTAFLNLFIEAGLETGQSALIHAGGSGVGTAAIQLVKAAGATPYITAGTAEKLARGRELGAALAINYKDTDFVSPILEATDGRGVDVVLDPVGANYLEKNLRVLADRGRIVQIGLLSGGQTEINLGLVMGKMARLIGSTLRRRPLAEKIDITRQFKERFWPLLVDGTLTPIVDRIFPIAEAQAAHAYVRANKNIGKVILEVK